MPISGNQHCSSGLFGIWSTLPTFQNFPLGRNRTYICIFVPLQTFFENEIISTADAAGWPQAFTRRFTFFMIVDR
jgi:hypothetical protein